VNSRITTTYYKLFTTLFCLLVLFFASLVPVYAHPGNVKYDGCHFCWTNCSSWGFTYGTRHNRDNPSATCSCDPSLGTRDPLYCPTTTQAGSLSSVVPHATWKFSANADGTYDVLFTWNSNQFAEYSLSINKTNNVDPGSLVDTDIPSWTFHNIAPGTWFVNMKAKVQNTWTQTGNWEVDVPAWQAPSPTDIPTPTTVVDTQVAASSGFNPQIFLYIIGILVIVWFFYALRKESKK